MKRNVIVGLGIGALAVGGVWAAVLLMAANAQTPDPERRTVNTSVGLVAAVRAPAGHTLEMHYHLQEGNQTRWDKLSVTALELYPNYVVYHDQWGGGGILFREKLWNIRWDLKAIPPPVVPPDKAATKTTTTETVKKENLPTKTTDKAEKK